MEPIRVMADRSAEPIVGWDMTRMTRSRKENGDRHQQRMHCFTPQMHKIEMLMAIPRRFLPNKARDSCWRKTDDSRPSGPRSLQTAAGKKENRQFGPGRMCCFDIGEGWEEKDGYRFSARDCHQRCMQTIDSSIISAYLEWFSMRCRYEPLQAPFYETNVAEKSSTLHHQRVQFRRRGRPRRGQGLGMTPMLSAQGLAQGFWWFRINWSPLITNKHKHLLKGFTSTFPFLSLSQEEELEAQLSWSPGVQLKDLKFLNSNELIWTAICLKISMLKHVGTCWNSMA